MNIQEAKEEIIRTVRSYTARNEDGTYIIPSIRQRPMLLIGPPGIGKTAIMEQAAETCKVGLVSYTITHHTRQSAIGLPVIREKEYGGRNYSVTEYTMSEIIASVYDCMERTGLKEGILFIDEINCVSETLAPAMLEFLQNKTFGVHKVPEGWIIAAAGNPPGYNKSVREFDVVTLDRVRVLHVEEDLDVWLSYAAERRIHPIIMAYLQLRKNDFYRIEDSLEGPSFVTARGWEDLSVMLRAYERQGYPVDAAFVREFLQHGRTASDFAAYYRLYARYKDDYQIGRILDGSAVHGNQAVSDCGSGKENQAAREGCQVEESRILERASRASYEERITLINLLADALKQGDKDKAEESLDHIMDFLQAAYGEGSETAMFLRCASLYPETFGLICASEKCRNALKQARSRTRRQEFLEG